MIKQVARTGFLRQTLRNATPAFSTAVNHAQMLIPSACSASAQDSSRASRHSLTMYDQAPKKKVAKIYKVPPDRIHPIGAGRAHLPIFGEQTRFKSALLDNADNDYSELMKSAFDAKLARFSVDINRKAHEEITRQAEEVLHGHIHDRSSSDLKILDLASGAGEPAATLAQHFPEATVFSTDINPQMIEAARERVNSRGISNVKYEIAEMEDLSEFDDETFDLVTCSYGLAFCEDPEMALCEIHRVLKNGGTLIATVWDSLSTERASERILQAACGEMNLPDRILDPMAMARPRLLEDLLVKNNLSLVQVSHGEYPFILSCGDDFPEDFEFRFVSMSVHPNLIELAKSGQNPNSLNDAKKAFESILAQESDRMKRDADGNLATVPNRYKLVIARRGYDKVEKAKKHIARSRKRLNLLPGSKINRENTPADVSEALDSVLIDTYSRISNGPWEHMLKCVESILHGHDTSKVRILDLSSGPGEPACMLAKRFPRASIVATDISPKVVDRLKRKIAGLRLRNTRALAADPQNLSSFQAASYDVVTCSLGLSAFTEEEANRIMKEVHRILKPGGSLVATVWDSMSIEHISDEILEDIMQGESLPPRVFDFLSLSAPRKLEEMIENGGMSIIQVDHDEFSFQLSGLSHQQDDFAFNVATIPIHPNLVNLQKSGEKPDVFEDAQKAFEKVVDEGSLVHVDSQGRLWTGPNRFKIVVARRQYEDADK